MFRCLISIVLIGLSVTSCSSSPSESAFESDRRDVEAIQVKFREILLSEYEQPEQNILVIAPPSSTEGAPIGPKQPSQELKAWRADISEAWNQIPNDKFFMVCDILFEGVLDPQSSFASSFSDVRKKFEQDGVELYSLTDVALEMDNRETIEFPTPGLSSSLFVCSSQITLRMANGEVLPPQTSTVAWNYYADGTKIGSTLSFILKSNS